MSFKKFKSGHVLVLMIFLIIIFVAPNGYGKTSAGLYPERNVVWLVPYKPGGATDNFARAIGKLFKETGIADVTFEYENKPGASGQIGLGVAVEKRKGDDHVLIPISSTYTIYNKIRGDKYSYKDLKIVAQFASDYELIVVNKAAKFKTFEEFVRYGKKETLTYSHSGVGGGPHITGLLLADALGIKVRAVPFVGARAATTAILGNQVNFSILNPNEAASGLKGGRLIALASCSQKRIEYLPDVPTLRELGTDFVAMVTRGIGMPPGVSETALNYWEEKSLQLIKTKEFKAQYLELQMLSGSPKTGAEYKKELDKNYKDVQKILDSLGLAK